METRQLIVWGFAAACLRLGDARFLSVFVPTYWDNDVVAPALMDDMEEGAALPERDHSREPARNPGKPQRGRIHPALQKFPWRVLDGQSAVLKSPAHPLQQRSVKTDRLAVRCGESKVQVEVKQDLMGRGKLVKPEELTLGGCPPVEVDNWAHVLAFESELHGCGSTLVVRKPSLPPVSVASETQLLSLPFQMRGHTFVYVFMLVYQPRKTDNTPIIRSQGALIGVECHYLR